MTYRDSLFTMLASATFVNPKDAGMLYEAILKLNQDTIELGRTRLKESDLEMSANAMLIKLRDELGEEKE